MSFLAHIDSNGYEVLVALTVANFLAQILKTIIAAISKKKLDLSRLVTTGGMPSSHSAAVTAMTASIGLIRGCDAIEFAVAFCFSAVVMYDSAGIRQAAGRQARVLNQIIEEILSDTHHLSTSKLKELLGHTPLQVIAGAILGVIVSTVLRFWIEANL